MCGAGISARPLTVEGVHHLAGGNARPTRWLPFYPQRGIVIRCFHQTPPTGFCRMYSNFSSKLSVEHNTWPKKGMPTPTRLSGTLQQIAQCLDVLSGRVPNYEIAQIVVRPGLQVKRFCVGGANVQRSPDRSLLKNED